MKQKTLLPLFDTVIQSYTLAWQYKAEYWRIAKWWMLFSLPIYYVLSWISWPDLGSVVCPDQSEPDSLVSMVTSGLGLAVVFVLVSASIAVAWHRFVLRGDRVEGRYLRYDGPVVAYAVFGIILMALSSIPTLLMTAATKLDESSLGLVLLGLAITPFICFYIVRLGIYLPAVALEQKQVSLMEVLRRTRWNFWRLFWGTIFCTIPSMLFNLVLSPTCMNKGVDVTIYVASHYGYFLIVEPIMLSFLSLSYKHFFENETAA